jgi:peptidyl-prolyl cis-trans isomerase D
MLDAIRRLSHNLIGRAVLTLLFGVLIIAFAVWGVGDMFRGMTSTTVAQVGRADISAQQFQRDMQTLMYRYQARTRSNLTNAQAHAMGLDAEVLQGLVAEAALDQRAAALGLAISDAAIADAVRADPALQDASGQFSRARFDAALRDSGLSERGFFVAQSKEHLRREMELAMVLGLAPPKPLVEALARVAAQTRAVDYVTLPPAAAGDIAAPSEDALNTYYEQRKAAYRAPEYRGFTYLLASPTSVARVDQVSDDEAKALYDKSRDSRFTTAEKRKLEQIVFQSEAEADAVEAKIKAGASFDEVVKAGDLKPVDLGETTKDKVYDPAVGEAAFALPEGGASEVVKGPFGPVILHVVAITPASVKSYAEVADALKKDIALGRAADAVLAAHDKVEDALVSGKPLVDAAKIAGLEPQTVAAADAQGRDPNGAAVELPEKDLLLRSVFSSDVGVDNAALQTADRGYLWYEVDKVDPARDRRFDEVRAEVEKQWRADALARALAAKAADMVKQLDGGAELAALAQSAGLEVKSAKDVHRSGGGGLADSVVAAAFSSPPNGAGSAATPDGRVVFKIVADATPPINLDDAAVKAAARQLAGGLQSGVVEQFIMALERELGVKVNESVLEKAEGG